LCLTLRDTAGQSARVLTGYDLLLVSVLTEAQAGRLPTTEAGRCPFRGFRTAQVVDAATPAMQAGAAVALLAGSAGLDDKIQDGDAPVLLRPAVSRTARRFAAAGAVVADGCDLDGLAIVCAPTKARAAEVRPAARLDELLDPSGSAVAAVFSHTALAAGTPENGPHLATMGDAFGRLMHLVDATEDRASDRRHGRFNPLEATGTDHARAGELARCLHRDIVRSFERLELRDEKLAENLLGPTLGATIRRVWPQQAPASAPPSCRSERPTAVGIAAAMMAPAAMLGHALAMFGGGRRARRRADPYGRYGYDPYGPGYGRRRGCGGPSCGELLACDCCANLACDDCCGEDCCCCCI
ncbi:MAG: hypothetical protein JWM85_16, partial [Acidimicrobiaceae bacterium]|nr:hypothetical protein [Acidimicrobiaceae bacterium]